ncbi:methyl-accepting chemotaxis protein [Rhodovulum bhavnagarense]|uniref:Methyl-accepting chemotaxis protein n=1 Tax=Rhodovulum bhavnagarense TaxID=992286 RepID=A0A4R2RNJ7_9RHOB|nr:methyl-accepting chemotaxis protein [Rhodovulum bhavnagarense]TCP61371.1 methyl-accepting chemotaxis protein [Rhodovulum bhavnagarense]
MIVSTFRNIPIARKLPLVIAGLSFAAATATGWIAYNRIQSAMFHKESQALIAISGAPADEFARYFKSLQDEVVILSLDTGMNAAIRDFSAGFKALGMDTTTFGGADPEISKRELRRVFVDENPYAAEDRAKLVNPAEDSAYASVHARSHMRFREIIERRGFHDMFLIDADGNVVYTVTKERDFATNVKTGEWADTGLGRTFRAAMSAKPDADPIFDYFAEYAPSGGLPSAFVGRAVYDAAGKPVGTLIFQISLAVFEDMTDSNDGLGETGDIYLVGGDYLMRTNLRHGGQSWEETALKRRVETEAVRNAVEGRTGVMRTVNYRDHETLAAYRPLDVFGYNWAVIAEMDMAEIHAPAVAMRNVILAIVTAISLIVALIGLLFARGIVKPLKAMQAGLARISETRDLSVRVGIGTRDEIGQSTQSVDDILNFIEDALRNIRASAEQAGEVAGQLSDAAQATASNSEIQSSSVEEVSSSVEETDSQVKANAESAREANSLVNNTTEVATEGKKKIEEMVVAMDQISSASQDIAKIIKVIDDIAFQTNLLALNAAVEAARAGQHGRGFAVVAQEVRNLAGRSAKAAKETSDLIEGSAQRVNNGVEIAALASRSFQSVADDVARMKDLVAEIAAASEEQARGVSQINTAIGEVSKTAQETSQQSEELAATAEELSKSTDSMLDQVRSFRLSGERANMLAETANEAAGASAVGTGASIRVLAEARPDLRAAPVNGNAAPRAKVQVNGAQRPQDRIPLDHDERGYGGF